MNIRNLNTTNFLAQAADLTIIRSDPWSVAVSVPSIDGTTMYEVVLKRDEIAIIARRMRQEDTA